MKIDDNDKLKSLFQNINLDEPSADFENRVMHRVHIVTAKQKRKNILRSTLSIAGGIAAALGIPVLIFYLFGFSPDTDFLLSDFKTPHMQFDPLMTSILAAGFLLLIGDLLVRKRIWNKKQKG